MKRLVQILLVLTILSIATDAFAVRIKDIAYVQGVRNNQLLGYGLVVGLAGSGDFGRAEVTVQTTASMLSRLGIKVDKDKLRTRNVAAVMVTADLPAFSRSGQKLDVVVSSLGNARSLQGGTLLMAPLMGPDGKVYAVAQGPMSVGGYSASGGGGNSQTKNHVTAGRIPNGALVEKDLGIDLSKKSEIRLILREPDFSTAVEVARKLSETFAEEAAPPAEKPAAAAADPNAPPAEAKPVKKVVPAPFTGIASAIDSATVRIEVPESFKEHVTQFISSIELVEVTPSRTARVIVNERTGTVVLGGDVRLSEVAVAHGNLNVKVETDFFASQPAPFGEGETRVVPDSKLDVDEQKGPMAVVNPGASIGDVVSALNAIGASPRDMIAILQAIKSAGALNAELVIQ